MSARTHLVRSAGFLAFVLLGLALSARGQAPGLSRAAEQSQRPLENPAYRQARQGPWCAATRLWQAKSLEQAATAGGCPEEGGCDDSAIRDATGIPPTDITVNVIVHVMREDNGTGGISEATVDASIAQLNQDHAANGSGFQFVLTATRFHNNSALASIAKCSPFSCNAAFNDIATMKDLYAESPETQLNVFISGQDSSRFGVLLGLGTFPWDLDALTAQGGVWMNEIAAGAGGRTLTHEVGHCLGLWHTHHGVSEVSSCSDCYEYATGFEGDVRGDFASDTPPTPTNYECAAPGGSDCEGTPWGATQPENFMGYGPDTCMSLFSDQQNRRQQCWTAAVLSGWFATQCAADADNDGVCDADDVCPGADDRVDSDGDGVPDGCDPCPLDNPDDSDGDGVCDTNDPCPFDNPDDSDGDGVCDLDDACPGHDDAMDADADGLPDGCDACPFDPDNDADGDGICGDVDNCPDTANADQTDTNGNGVGDACEGGCTVGTTGVAAIVLSVEGLAKGQKRGRAEVTVEDNCGNPVAGVVVTGTFTGDFAESASALTDSNGVAVLGTTTTKKGRTRFTFCVDAVNGGAVPYDAATNAETCDSF